MRARNKILFGLVVLVVIVILILHLTPKKNSPDEEITKCIGSKSTLYVSTGCSACNAQKKLFGENFKYLNIVDCAVEPGKCGNILYVPTWIINNEKKVGVQSIETLKELTGC